MTNFKKYSKSQLIDVLKALENELSGCIDRADKLSDEYEHEQKEKHIKRGYSEYTFHSCKYPCELGLLTYSIEHCMELINNMRIV